MLVVVAALVIFFIFILTQTGVTTPMVGIILVIIFIVASFSSLNVVIDETHLRIKFGWGIFRKSFNLQEITSVQAVRNHWYYGWGIRVWLWPRTVIFNVSGFDAVEIIMTNNQRFRIGTDEPQKLETALRQAIAK